MDIRVGFDMTFETAVPTAMVVILETHPTVAGRLLRPDFLRTSPNIPLDRFEDSFGNRCVRLVSPVGQFRLMSDGLVWDNGELDPVPTAAEQHPVQDLPPACLPFLLPSRYCEVDLLVQKAWELFQDTQPGWERVTAVLDWVHQNIQYGYEFARPTKTATEVLAERAGVCRDFQHLAISFCRALNIPARYASGYLGDIRVPPLPTPMDFHAWFEVYLGGRWYPVDARHNQPRIGRILMARGRDAADTALTTTFGVSNLVDFKVWADEVPREAPIEPDRSETEELLLAA